MSAQSDELLLQRALELARAGMGSASPNPYVGAVITDVQGNIAGEGTYTYAGLKHAEILALEAAGSKAHGGTLYINLEPHAHHGRTPPCTDRLIAAGIGRVVASMSDPNPKVSGRGFAALRAAGLQVETGCLEAQARRLNEAFARYIRRGVPLVTLKSAMTLDGKIAPLAGHDTVQRRSVSGNDKTPDAPSGTSAPFSGHWITGEAARAHVQVLRHEHDAILAGIGTILADNPLLTDRSGHPRRRPLLRVILDSQLRLPPESRIVESVRQECGGDVLVFTSAAGARKKSQLEGLGARVEVAPASEDGQLDLPTILGRLGQLEITSVMIEGGSTVNAAAMAAGLVDKVFLYYAPELLGRDAVPFLAPAAAGSAIQPARVNHPQLHRFGEDFAIEGYLRDPYQD